MTTELFLWFLLLWFTVGLVSSVAIYAIWVYYSIPDDLPRSDPLHWCPSPGAIIMMLLGTALGYTTALILAIMLVSHALTRLFSNDRFWEWLSTPVCDKRMPVTNPHENTKKIP